MSKNLHVEVLPAEQLRMWEAFGELDLLAPKLKVLNQRVEAKDYIDIAVILQRSPNATQALQQGLANMEKMFPEGSAAITLKTLCCHND